ncbi:MAG: hypothetical protein EOP02_11370, partial [Proteobacteria bacterium]
MNSFRSIARSRVTHGAASALAIALATPAPVYAQEEAGASESGTPIIVTGSRIKRDGFNEPTPATVIGIDLMQDLGQVS